jgi:hypothetical protein
MGIFVFELGSLVVLGAVALGPENEALAETRALG